MPAMVAGRMGIGFRVAFGVVLSVNGRKLLRNHGNQEPGQKPKTLWTEGAKVTARWETARWKYTVTRAMMTWVKTNVTKSQPAQERGNTGGTGIANEKIEHSLDPQPLQKARGVPERPLLLLSR